MPCMCAGRWAARRCVARRMPHAWRSTRIVCGRMVGAQSSASLCSPTIARSCAVRHVANSVSDVLPHLQRHAAGAGPPLPRRWRQHCHRERPLAAAVPCVGRKRRRRPPRPPPSTGRGPRCARQRRHSTAGGRRRRRHTIIIIIIRVISHRRKGNDLEDMAKVIACLVLAMGLSVRELQRVVLTTVVNKIADRCGHVRSRPRGPRARGGQHSGGARARTSSPACRPREARGPLAADATPAVASRARWCSGSIAKS